MIGKTVDIELKNDMVLTGTLQSVDQFLNMKLSSIEVHDVERYPHMLSVKDCFIRGSVVRYVTIPEDAVDVELLQDAARREAAHVAAQQKSVAAQ
ncbi:U6 snRNA-associated Sm-like proteinLSm2 [Paramicrosporidium saccamoebae]|uniref:U6 snRNA-associated Sm-like proteinLSm2 n=1 Tax=Paramicrosporidium saccamoebae TaxID=1246581 RepID=A0A2H9TQP6_9FUNG|nr:U6 snRNA-associated Sm-like proteinLSm2 [Paramicrosporidium saccamoebae]